MVDLVAPVVLLSEAQVAEKVAELAALIAPRTDDDQHLPVGKRKIDLTQHRRVAEAFAESNQVQGCHGIAYPLPAAALSIAVA